MAWTQPSYAISCSSIAEIVCNEPGFTTLCTALAATPDLKSALESSAMLTIFAPTDDAFNNLPEGMLQSLLNDIPTLSDLLLYHVKEGEFAQEDLTCDESITMSNDQETTTVCQDGQIYQVGNKNTKNNLPQIIMGDIKACNGMVHAVSEVLLPVPPVKCSTITEIACTTKGFSTLCKVIEAAGLSESLSGTDPFTIFAPTDMAFDKLPTGLLDALLNENIPKLTDLVLYHAVEGVVSSSDLKCQQLVSMGNGRDTRTICRENDLYQKGSGNTHTQLPKFITTDITACNGLLHAVSEVLLPPPPMDQCSSIVDIACGSPDFSNLCMALEMSGLDAVFDGPEQFTFFAPTNAAFDKLPKDIKLTDLMKDDNIPILIDILTFHAVQREVYSTALTCSETITMMNEEDSLTVCDESHIYQKGLGNIKQPEIVAFDMTACNGLVHVVNQVMLPPP